MEYIQEPKQESKKESEQIDMNAWLEKEEKQASSPTGDFEKLPSPAFRDGKVTTVKCDFSKPFNSWTDQKTGKVKAIIPCRSVVEGALQKCNWWLNKRNPIYKDVIRMGREAKDKSAVLMKIMQIGTQDKTTYRIINDEEPQHAP